MGSKLAHEWKGKCKNDLLFPYSNFFIVKVTSSCFFFTAEAVEEMLIVKRSNLREIIESRFRFLVVL